MSSKLAVDVSFPGEAASRRVPSLVRWTPHVTHVVPVVRWALLYKYDPPLTANAAKRTCEAIEAVWADWKESYRANVAALAGVPTNSIEVDPAEMVRLRYDGKTPMIDFPKVESVPGTADPLDLRYCAALCVDNFSSKLWTRIGPPYRRASECPASELRSALRRYRDIAHSCGKWFHDEFGRFSRGSLSGHEQVANGGLEVITVGLKIDDELSTDDLGSWLFDSNGGPNLGNDDLRRFITDAASLSYDIRELSSREPKAFWMSMPMAVRLENGDLVSRTALYLVRPVDEVLQVIGVGLDDSESGAFASEVALKVSRVIANRI